MTEAEGIDIDAVKGGELNVATNQAQARAAARRGRARPTSGARPDYQLLEARGRPRADRRRRHRSVGAWTPALRPDPAGQAGRAAWPRPSAPSASRSTSRPRSPGSSRPRPTGGDASAGDRPRHGPRDVRAAGDRGVHRRPARAAPHLAADELQPDRDRAPAGARCGTRSAGPGGRRSGDLAHAYMYAQRTADDRIAIGGRGVPYRYGSRTDHDGKTHASTVAALQRDPASAAAGHAGRRDRPRLVRRARPCRATGARPPGWTGGTGLGWAGGYVGHGVATTNLAGRTLRDLVLGEPTDLTALPWVGPQGPAVGARAAALARRADPVRGVPGGRPAREPRRRRPPCWPGWPTGSPPAPEPAAVVARAPDRLVRREPREGEDVPMTAAPAAERAPRGAASTTRRATARSRRSARSAGPAPIDIISVILSPARSSSRWRSRA